MPNLSGVWLLEPGAYETLAGRYASCEPSTFDAEAVEAFIGRSSQGVEGRRLYGVANGTAHIPIVGVLTKEPDYFLDRFGGGNAVYGDIVQAVQAADADDTVERIVLEIDSPGGAINGLFECCETIAAAAKPVEAQVTDTAASAAYALASQAGRIVVNNPMAVVGSVGIVTSLSADSGRVTITSTDAPDKAPDVSTPEGVAKIREYLDAVHAQFVAIIARGRGVDTSKISADYGRGGVVLAEAALTAGMIDDINTALKAKTPAVAGGARAMDENELKAKHPALHAMIFAAGRTEGHAAGVEAERDRVEAHLTLAESHTAPLVAVGHIRSGASVSSDSVYATYAAAGRKAAELDARSDDNPDETQPAAAGATTVTDPEAVEAAGLDAVFALVRANNPNAAHADGGIS